MRTPPVTQQRLIALVGFALFVLPMLRVGRINIPIFWDDIGVVFVYALNLIETGAIFYNVPADRIDGFTSMLDVLFVVPLALLDPDNLFRLNYYAKALVTSLVPVALFAALLRLHTPALLAAAAALALAMSDVLAYGFGMLLEAPVYALLLVGFLVNLCLDARRNAWLATLFGCLLCITRPEALALVTAGVGARLIFRAGLQPLAATLATGAGILTFIVAWLSWRIAYFGFWAPNTYYAKLGGTRSEEIMQGLAFVGGYFSRAADTGLYIALVLLTIALVPLWLRQRRHPESVPNLNTFRISNFAICTAVAGTMLAVRIATGGDSYTISSRLLIDFAVPAAMATGLGLAAASFMTLQRVALAAVAFAVLGNGFVVLGSLPGNITGFMRTERILDRQLDCERDAIREAFARYPGARLAHTDFQRAKYFVPQMEVIDLSGLNNRDIAHATTGEVNPYGKHDLNYALREQAEILKLGTGVMEFRVITNEDWLNSLREDREVARDFRNARPFLLANAAELQRDYEPVAIETACSGSYLNLLVRRDAERAD